MFHCTVAPEGKPVPFTVSVKAGPPAAAEIGLKFVMIGAGGSIGKLTKFDVTPPLYTVSEAIPWEAMRFAGTAAVSCVEFTKVVGNAELSHSNVAPIRNPVPFTVRVKAVPPAEAEVGLRLVIAGTGGLIWKLTGLDTPPPGLATVTFTLAATAIRLAGTAAVSCVALTKVVDRAEPFHCTTAPGTKPAPFTVRVKAAPPAVVDVGFRLAMGKFTVTTAGCVTVVAIELVTVRV